MNDVTKQIVVKADQLCKTYTDGGLHVDVLNNLDLSVEQAEMVAIVGASGVGKTTLLQLLGGLDKPTSGKIIIADEDMTHLDENEKARLRNYYLGFIYQFHHLLPEFNALENVCMPLLIRGLKPKAAIKKAQELIERVGLQERMQHRIGELSGGERQRIAIARALVTEPKCVLADEPTGNLDQKTADHIYQTMLELNKDLQTSFIVVTHNQALAAQLDRTLVLQEGRLRAIDS